MEPATVRTVAIHALMAGCKPSFLPVVLGGIALIGAIGLILDWRTPGDSTAYSASAFRWAMSAQFVLWAVGLTQVYRYRLRSRRVVNRDELELA